MSDIKGPLDYRGKLMLAPMVKVGTLPTRLLALHYGADIVYTEELIDWRLLRTERIENKALGTIDFIDMSDNSLVFRTCNEERGKLVLQIGTCDANRAAMVAKKMEKDIDGIDVNMGCPKSFSIKGGMGAALLKQPQKIKDILTRMKEAVDIPVTCKIRINSDINKTLDLVKVIETTGVAALAVHGRTKDQRPNDPNNIEAIKQIVQSTDLTIIANGGSSNNRDSDINTYEGINNFWKESGASSVMIARAAEWNTSVFKPEGKEDILTVVDKYLFYAIKYDYPFTLVKYCTQQLLGGLQTSSEQGRKFLETSTVRDICKVFNVEDKYLEKQKQLEVLGVRSADDQRKESLVVKLQEGPKKRKYGEDEVTEMFMPFVRGHYSYEDSRDLPKTRLEMWTKEQGFIQPIYRCQGENQRFKSVVQIDKRLFSSESWEKSKRHADQAAALVAINCLNVPKMDQVESKKKSRHQCNCDSNGDEGCQ